MNAPRYDHIGLPVWADNAERLWDALPKKGAFFAEVVNVGIYNGTTLERYLRFYSGPPEAEHGIEDMPVMVLIALRLASLSAWPPENFSEIFAEKC